MKEETSNFPGMTRRANELEIFTFSYDPEGVLILDPMDSGAPLSGD